MRFAGKPLSWCFACLAIVGALTIIYACGIVEPKYVDYNEAPLEGAAPPEEEGDDECQVAALAAFDEHIQANIATCATSGCHGSTYRIGGSNLDDSDSSVNRDVFLSFSEGDAEILFAEYSTSSHRGGDLSGILPLSNLESWLEAEAECD